MAWPWILERSSAWRAERVRRPDLELAAAAAEALDVSLNDVFAVETTPADELAAADEVLDPEQSRRLEQLFDLQERRPLSADEQAEMRALVAEYGRRVYDQGVQRLAAKRGVPVEQVRAEVTADLARLIAWRRDLEADPTRWEALINQSRDQRRARAPK